MMMVSGGVILAACTDNEVDISTIPDTDLSIYTGGEHIFDESFGVSLTFSDDELSFPSKRGIVTTDPTYAETVGAGWYYNRVADATGADATSAEYVPMLYGGGSATAVVEIAAAANSSRIFGFYRPDSEDAANLTTESALDKWSYLMEAGLPLGSPAVVDASSSSTWLEPFMAEIDELGYRVDYICVQYNGAPDADDLQSLCEEVYTLYQRPIVVAELSIAEGDYTEEMMKKFVKESIVYLDSSNIIYGYAWNPDGENSMLIDEQGALTAIGEVFLDPTSYDAGRVSESSLPSYVSPTYSDNLIEDGGFEDGGSQWSISGGSAISVDSRGETNLDAFLYGDNMLIFSGASAGSASQSITRSLYEGDTYKFGFVGRIGSAIGGAASDGKLYMSLESAGGEVLASTSMDIVDNFSTNGYDTTFVVDAATEALSLSEVVVKIYKEGGDSDIAYVDNIYLCQSYYSDAHIYEKPIYSYYDSSKLVTNLVVDGGFELESEESSGIYWVKKSTTVFHSKAGVDEPAENMITGRGSIKLVGDSYVNTQQKITIELGKTYIFGCTARAQSGDGPEGTTASSSFGFNLRGRSGGSGNAISSANSTYGATKLLSSVSSVSTSTNTQIMIQWTVPSESWQGDSELAAGAVDTEVYINLAKQGNSGTIYVDDVFFYEVDAADL